MQNALPNLEASLKRVRAIADDVDFHVQDALRDPTIQARHETTLCSATVILSGFLESFLREVAEEMIGEICARALPFNQLPATVRITHYWHGALHLREMARREKGERPLVLDDASDAARRLASVVGPQLPYELIWEAFAETQANPGPSEISEFLKRFDIEAPLPSLAAAMSTTENTLVLRLRSFMQVRNECAHTGTAKNIPTASDVRAYCDLISNIAAGIVTLFKGTLGAPPYLNPPPAPAVP